MRFLNYVCKAKYFSRRYCNDLTDEIAQKYLKTCNAPLDKPGIIFGENQLVVEPDPIKLAELLGLDLSIQDETQFDTLIVGGGPSGVAAGVYAGAEGLSALVVEELSIGGQAGSSSRIENYLGFPTGISGADLVWRGEIQAMKFGTQFAIPRKVVSVKCLEGGTFECFFE